LTETQVSLQRRLRAGRSLPGAGCVTRPHRPEPSDTGAARSVRLSRARHAAGAGGVRSRVARRTTRRFRATLSDGLPPFRAQRPPRPRARNLGEAGSAQPPQAASTARWGQPQSCVRVTVPRVRIPPSPQKGPISARNRAFPVCGRDMSGRSGTFPPIFRAAEVGGPIWADERSSMEAASRDPLGTLSRASAPAAREAGCTTSIMTPRRVAAKCTAGTARRSTPSEPLVGERVDVLATQTAALSALPTVASLLQLHRCRLPPSCVPLSNPGELVRDAPRFTSPLPSRTTSSAGARLTLAMTRAITEAEAEAEFAAPPPYQPCLCGKRLHLRHP
jgi:hypothetical protein